MEVKIGTFTVSACPSQGQVWTMPDVSGLKTTSTWAFDHGSCGLPGGSGWERKSGGPLKVKREFRNEDKVSRVH